MNEAIKKEKKPKKERHPIPTEEDIVEVKEYWMIHAGHTSDARNRSSEVYYVYEEAKNDAIKLAMINPNKRFYLMKACETYISKVKDSVLEAKEIK